MLKTRTPLASAWPLLVGGAAQAAADYRHGMMNVGPWDVNGLRGIARDVGTAQHNRRHRQGLPRRPQALMATPPFGNPAWR